jgi:uncharacterized protein
MEQRLSLKDSQIVILGLLICVATITSSWIFSQGFLKVKKFSAEVISVTGSAEKKIVSDSIVWRLSFSRRDAVMTEAYRQLDENRKQVRDYLIHKGILDQEMSMAPVQTEILYQKNEKGMDTNFVEAYRLSQDIWVSSSDVLKVSDISRMVTELIPLGIELISNAPQYFYTRLGELKVEMLREAAKDAKKRADEIASSTGNKISLVRSAKMGVFQITPANSYDFSDWGTNDTSSYEKKVTAVVKADFAIQ